MPRNTYVKKCKVLVLGDSGVGKTAIVHRLTESEFRPDLVATLGVQFSFLDIEIEKRAVELHIADTAGQEHDNSLTPTIMNGVDACVIVFNVTNVCSFEHIERWRHELLESGRINEPEELPCIVFANKSDVDESATALPISEARAALEKQQMMLFEVSAKSGQNIHEGFTHLASQFLARKRPIRQMTPNMISSEGRTRSDCC
jgi:Ras-related protein Rab-7A